MRVTALVSAAVLLAVLVAAVSVAALPHALRGHWHRDFEREWRAKDEALRARGVRPEDVLPPAQWFTQTLDHFDAQNTATWQQKYYVNATFFQPGGPIFLYIGGEGPLSARSVVDLQMLNYAQQYNALVVALEHRFYGDSNPLGDLSMASLRYLSAQQALADLANFRQMINTKYGSDSTSWVSFGGSYPGAMSSWFRIKYPHLVDGAISSSGPVHAELNFVEYLEVVQNSLLMLGGANANKCVANIAAAFTQLQAMMGSQSGRNQVQNMFSTCSPIQTDKDVATFISNVMGNFMGTVQYNVEIPGAFTIGDVCNMMTGTSAPLQLLATTNAKYNAAAGQTCTEVSYTDMIAQLKNESLASGVIGGRQWTYQTCTAFGYFQSTDAPSTQQPFGSLVPVTYYTDMCKDIFGLEMTQAQIDWTNTYFGDRNPQGSNIVYVNGDVDPWHALSILNDVSDTEVAILIHGTAHCANMHVWTPAYPEGMKIAQAQIAAFIATFLN